MTAFLPWIALALGVAMFFLESQRVKREPAKGEIIALALVALFVVGSWFVLGKLEDHTLAMDYPIVAFALALGFVAASAVSPTTGLIGLAAFALGFNQWHGQINPGESAAWLATLGGLSMMVAKSRGWVSAAGFGAAVMAGGMANALGAAGPGGHAAWTGAVFCLAAVLAGAVGFGIKSATRGDRPVVVAAVSLVVFAISVGALGQVYLAMRDTVILGLVAIFAAAISVWNTPAEGESSPLRVSVLALIWLGLATFAFSLRAGYGMAVVGVAGVLTILLLDRPRALPAMVPILALTAYRVFREIYPDESRAFDIGQHYAIVGLIAGIVIVLGVVEFGRKYLAVPGVRSTLAGACIMALAVLLSVFSIVFLGSKGVVGLIIGLGLSAMLASMGGRGGLTSFGLSGMLTGVVILGHRPLLEYIDIEKGSKQTLLVIVVIIVAIFAATAWLSVRPTNEPRNEPA